MILHTHLSMKFTTFPDPNKERKSYNYKKCPSHSTKVCLIWTLVHCPSLHGQVNRALQGFRWQWGNLQILLENKEMVSYPHNFSTVSGMWWRKRNENNSDGQRSGFNLWNSCFPKTKSIKILSFIDSTSIWNRNSLIVLCFNKQVMFKVTCTNGVKK